ncbi:hypothetical protein EDP1_1714 [Pseudomonas putida S610]|nr:hypothetical protein EDP1_1714 [Pseudomonas putida S610]
MASGSAPDWLTRQAYQIDADSRICRKLKVTGDKRLTIALTAYLQGRPAFPDKCPARITKVIIQGAIAVKAQQGKRVACCFVFIEHGQVNSFVIAWLSLEGQVQRGCRDQWILLKNDRFPCIEMGVGRSVAFKRHERGTLIISIDVGPARQHEVSVRGGLLKARCKQRMSGRAQVQMATRGKRLVNVGPVVKAGYGDVAVVVLIGQRRMRGINTVFSHRYRAQ